MKHSLFITGASGFIAGHLLRGINPEEYENIYCLSRKESKLMTSLSKQEGFKFIKGSIYDADLYAPYLAASDIVVHFAAITGKARPDEYFKVNSEGTEFLIKQCEKAGVRNFLYLSSIAVKFPDISSYYYAQSKKQGEDALRSSTLNYTIVRPAIVIGQGSPILESLSKLARAPVIPIFGDGTTKIQPIYVNDLADCLLHILKGNIFQNETFDLGGPEVITIEDFIKKIHQGYSKERPRTIHIPLGLLIPLLSHLEKYFYSFLPFTIGQLSSFRYDGTIGENRLYLKLLPGMQGVDKMLELSIGSVHNLEHECEVFGSYLINQKPNEYVLEKYQEGHQKGEMSKVPATGSFDRLLLTIAGINPFFTKLTDLYSRLFFKGSILRKKLVLLLAILECSTPAHHYFLPEKKANKGMFYIKTFQVGFFSLFTLILFSAIVMPFHLILTKASRSPGQ